MNAISFAGGVVGPFLTILVLKIFRLRDALLSQRIFYGVGKIKLSLTLTLTELDVAHAGGWSL